MIDDLKWRTFVSKLRQLTDKDELKWSMDPPAQVTTLFPAISYTTQFEGKGIRVSSIESPFSKSANFKLTIVNEKGVPVWEVPPVSGVQELFEMVRFKAAGIDDLVRSLIDR